ncbi:MAG: acetyl-CoA carboxylase biotin carboxyl carrier protein [Alphaproteobacteria bacterium]|nr:acetyl-CoA carboxylase biotin carboxyl carrier protein [Alphaproteobacteria bacterium]
MEAEQKKLITDMAKLLHAQELTEVEYEANGVRVRVACHGQGGAAPQVVLPQPAAVSAPSAAAKSAGVEIVSPMVGVVYLSKDPSAPPFIKAGDIVSEGQVVCLIEAMKTFNPIKSTKTGKIAAVLVENGMPVEFNQPLFSVE